MRVVSLQVAVPFFLSLCLFQILSDIEAQVRPPESSMAEEEIPYKEGRVLVKLREAETAREFLLPYGERQAKHVAVLTRIKTRYGLRRGRPLFRGFHDQLARANASAAQHAAELEAFSAAKGRGYRDGGGEDLLPFYVLDTDMSQDVKAMVESLARDPDVEYAQPDYRSELNLVPNDYYADRFPPSDPYWFPQLSYMWGATQINSTDAADISLGEGVIVALVDSGVDYNHEDLRDNLWANPNEIPGDSADNDGNGYVDDVRGYDFVNGDNDPLDDQTHGTMMAGIISAVINNNIGIYGIAPRARIMALKAAAANGSIYSSTAAAAIQYAVAKGADVINNSYGPSQPTPSDPVIEAAVRYAHNNGVVVVVAAGNQDADVANYSPQNMQEPIVVGASNNQDQRQFISNFGSTVDLCAPGYSILSSMNSSLIGVSYHNSLEGKYIRAQWGTSLSAAYASGLAALALARNKNLTPAQVEQAMKTGAVAITQDPGKPIGNRIEALSTLADHITAVDHVGITNVSFTQDQLLVSGVLRRSSTTSCQLAWKTSAAGSWTNLTGITPSAVGQEFLAGSINVGAIREGIINLRLSCGALNSEISYYLNRIQDPGIFDKAGLRVGLLGNDNYLFKVARLAGTTWTQLSLQYRKEGDTAWLTNGVTLLVSPGPELSNAALFEIDSSAMSLVGKLRFKLTAQASGGGSPFTLTKEILVQADPSVARGWPVYAHGLVGEQQPTIVDLDGNGDREICIDMLNWGGGGIPGLQVLHHDGTESAGLGLWSLDFLSMGLSAGNLDGAAGKELLAPLGSSLHAYNGTAGSLQDFANWPAVKAGWWERWSGAPAPLVTDLDLDGSPEVVALNVVDFVNYTLSAFEADGTEIFTVAIPQTSYQIDSMAVIDLNNDGQKEILVTTQESSSAEPLLRAYRMNGAEYVGNGWPVNQRDLSNRSGSMGQYSAVALASGDVDGDIDDEIVLTNQLNEVIVLEKNGSMKNGFPQPLASTAGFPEAVIALGDIDTIPGAEVIVPNGNNLNVFTSNGTQAAGWPRTLSPILPGYQAYYMGSPIVADIDNNGVQEIVVLASVANFSPYRPEQRLLAWNAAGSVISQWNTYGGGYFAHNTGPAVLDLEGDGTLELLQVGHGLNVSSDGDFSVGGEEVMSRVFVWELPGSSVFAAMDWPVFRANSRRTSEYTRYGDVSGDGDVSAYDASRTAQVAVGITTFKTEQKQRGDVSGDGLVTAYDAALIGRKAVGLIARFPVDE